MVSPHGNEEPYTNISCTPEAHNDSVDGDLLDKIQRGVIQ